jgi:hypothetical protein
MCNSNNIRRALAGFFLLLFSFCVTPKRFLHDLLANHKDALSCSTQPVQQIASSGFHCHADDLVVEAPFLPEIQFYTSIILTSEPVDFKTPLYSLQLVCLSHTDSRGPPEFSIS